MHGPLNVKDHNKSSFRSDHLPTLVSVSQSINKSIIQSNNQWIFEWYHVIKNITTGVKQIFKAQKFNQYLSKHN